MRDSDLIALALILVEAIVGGGIAGVLAVAYLLLG